MQSRYFERLGVLDQVRSIDVDKPGARFVSDRTGRVSAFPFSNALNRDRTHAWQVKRAEFDALLFANAAKHGATTLEETRVTEVQLSKNGQRARVTAWTKDGETLEWHPRYLLGASGRDTFMASRMNAKASNGRRDRAQNCHHGEGHIWLLA